MNFSAYISCHIAMPWDTLMDVASVVECSFSKNVEPIYWDRESPYQENILPNSDCFIMISPGLKWSYYIQSLPPGCRKELKKAIKLGIPIYTVYKTSSKAIRIYETHIEDNYVCGITGTSDSLNFLKKSKPMNNKREKWWDEPKKNFCNEIDLPSFDEWMKTPYIDKKVECVKTHNTKNPIPFSRNIVLLLK